ncbi:MAG: right-handed parallel beta-helix repeat-containing protein [Planctomycetota bacterium]
MGETPTAQTNLSCAEAATPDEDGADDPIVLRGQSGITIRGRTIRADPAVVLHDCEGVTLVDCDLTRVQAGGCRDLRIVNCHLHDSEDNAVYLDDCRDVLIQGNRIERVRTGVLAHRSRGVRVIGNYCENVLGPLPGGQLVQFDKVAGAGNAITDNYAVNFRNASNPEDVISIYQSHGTSVSPILIENNYIVGDPEHGSAGKSDSGSGIMLGDNGGSWQVCRNNTLISPGQVGIGIACGENIVVEDNLILGASSDVANVGLYAWNQYEDQPAGQVTIRRNTVAWINANGDDNPDWDGGGFTRVIEEGNTFGGRSLLNATERPDPPNESTQPPVPFEEPDA